MSSACPAPPGCCMGHRSAWKLLLTTAKMKVPTTLGHHPRCCRGENRQGIQAGAAWGSGLFTAAPSTCCRTSHGPGVRVGDVCDGEAGRRRLFGRGAVGGAVSPPRPAGGAGGARAAHRERGGRLLGAREGLPELPGGAFLEDQNSTSLPWLPVPPQTPTPPRRAHPGRLPTWSKR